MNKELNRMKKDLEEAKKLMLRKWDGSTGHPCRH